MKYAIVDSISKVLQCIVDYTVNGDTDINVELPASFTLTKSVTKTVSSIKVDDEGDNLYQAYQDGATGAIYPQNLEELTLTPIEMTMKDIVQLATEIDPETGVSIDPDDFNVIMVEAEQSVTVDAEDEPEWFTYDEVLTAKITALLAENATYTHCWLAELDDPANVWDDANSDAALFYTDITVIPENGAAVRTIDKALSITAGTILLVCGMDADITVEYSKDSGGNFSAITPGTPVTNYSDGTLTLKFTNGHASNPETIRWFYVLYKA